MAGQLKILRVFGAAACLVDVLLMRTLIDSGNGHSLSSTERIKKESLVKAINFSNSFFASLILAVVAFSTIVNLAHADTFGSGANTFNIEFVTIGNPGNAADTTGEPNPAGSVPTPIDMGKFEISEQMIDKANALGGLGITKDTRGADKPATSMSWNEAARFVNWLNTSSGSTPAYKFAIQPGEVGYERERQYSTVDG